MPPICATVGYVEGDDVLCKQGFCTYPAKILQVESQNGSLSYLIHYIGWNRRYDEWVDANKLFPHTKEKANEAVERNNRLRKWFKKIRKSDRMLLETSICKS